MALNAPTRRHHDDGDVGPRRKAKSDLVPSLVQRSGVCHTLVPIRDPAHFARLCHCQGRSDGWESLERVVHYANRQGPFEGRISAEPDRLHDANRLACWLCGGGDGTTPTSGHGQGLDLSELALAEASKDPEVARLKREAEHAEERAGRETQIAQDENATLLAELRAVESIVQHAVEGHFDELSPESVPSRT